MIKGIGVDLCEIDRMNNFIDNDKFINRVLSEKEILDFDKLSSPKRKAEFLAGRFAGKEAYSKAYGTGLGEFLSFQDLEIINDKLGAPHIHYLKDMSQKIHISISHTDQNAVAFVVIEE